MADGSVINLPDHSERGHSRLGASGAERWMNCPGSVALLKELQLPESDEPDYRREGTAMHEAAEYCLTRGLDTWEIVGQTFNDTEIDAPMADAIQVYVNHALSRIKTADWHQVEYRVSSPVHALFYGTADLADTQSNQPKPLADLGSHPDDEISIDDLKGGEGIIVEPDDNPQLKYYAYGVIDTKERQSGVTLRDDLRVRLGIVQPRAFHHTGQVIREWFTTVGEIKEWVHDTLVPAMLATEYDNTLDAGPWCRFCPAKLVCPLLTSLFGAASKHNPKEIVNYDDASVFRSYQYAQAVKFYLKALEEETFRRLNTGRTAEGMVKLVNKKANRVYRSTAQLVEKGPEIPIKEAILAKFGDDAMNPASVKSPAELEKVSPAAKEFVKEHAYMPVTGLTVALWDDPRVGHKVQTATEAFSGALAALCSTPEE